MTWGQGLDELDLGSPNDVWIMAVGGQLRTRSRLAIARGGSARARDVTRSDSRG